MKKAFKPIHINASLEDLSGNGGIGRYVFLPGSDGRAREIAKNFLNLQVKSHPRGHNLYLGKILKKRQPIEVAAISTGMGCPSMEIILHELFCLGSKRFLRVGTAGSLQPNLVNIGDLINVSAAVRDESTTSDYVPLGFPAIAALEVINTISKSAKKLKLEKKLHTGIVHCKSSFYAREFGTGPLGPDNKHYLSILSKAGVLATEMETATLFIQSQLYNHQLKQQKSRHCILAGAILAILATEPGTFATGKAYEKITVDLIKLSIEAVKQLAQFDQNK